MQIILFWASQDDFWEYNFISLLVKKLEKHPNIVLCSGDINFINLDGKSTKREYLKIFLF